MRPLILVVSFAVLAISHAAVAESTDSATKLDEILMLLEAQSAELDEHRKLIARQNERIDRLQAQLDDQLAPQVPQAGIPDPVSRDTVATTTDDGETIASRVAETGAESSEAQEDDPTRAILDSLPGAMRLPGTNAVIRIGGFIKTSVIQSFDPLTITDRFITGAIPTEDILGTERESDIDVAQSRLSLDLREPTDFGLLRGYVEGDFDGANDTFRLRHAFGQRGDFLFGKTWSGFVDRTASPEEIDFEGLNGRINVRQAQVRFQPRIGKRYEMAVSLEDPAPRVTFGSGVSRIPDVVASGRVNFGEDIHVRIATLLRQVRAQWNENQRVTEAELGWGLSVSGRIDTPLWDARDKILFQVNAGKGYGRYVNDLRSVGDFDGAFSPAGKLELIEVVSGYISGQHWWGPNTRTNVTFGLVELDNPKFVPDDFYRRTFRASTNLIWSPTPRIDIGGELLWGRLENEDGSSGEAVQLQLAFKYLF